MLLLLSSMIFSTATAHGEKIEPTCGPKIKRNLVRVLDVSNVDSKQIAQFILDQVGPVEISTEETITAQTIFGRAWKLAEGIAAKRGCNVLIVLSEWSVEDGYIVSENPTLGITTSTPRRFSRAQVVFAKSNPEAHKATEPVPAEPSTPIEVSGWTTFENEFLSFEYPADWQLTPGSGTVLVEFSTPPSSRTPPAYCRVNRFPLSADFELRGQELLKAVQAEPSSVFGETATSLEIRTLSAGTALTGDLSGTMPDSDESFMAAVALIPQVDDLFLFRCDTLAEDYQPWLPVLARSLTSLTFTGSKTARPAERTTWIAHRSRVATSGEDVLVLSNGAVVDLRSPTSGVRSGQEAILIRAAGSCRLWLESDHVLACTLLREPEAAPSVSAVETRLEDTAANGAVLVLGDGNVYQVELQDRSATPLWLVSDELLVLEDREILNFSRGELVSVSKLK